MTTGCGKKEVTGGFAHRIFRGDVWSEAKVTG